MNYSRISRVVTLSLLLAIILNPAVNATPDPVNSTVQETAGQDPDTGNAMADLINVNRTMNENVTPSRGEIPAPVNRSTTNQAESAGRNPVPEVSPESTISATAVNGTFPNATNTLSSGNITITTEVTRTPTASPQIRNGTRTPPRARERAGVSGEMRIPARFALDQIPRPSAVTTAKAASLPGNLRETGGSQWTEAPPTPDFSQRTDHSTVVFHNAMWVIGGYDAQDRMTKNDVWYSGDGISWTRAASTAQFTPRYGHAAVTFNNRMWVIGGMDDIDGYKSDIWSSADGVTWTLATESAGFSPRIFHQAFVFNNRIWVIGGSCAGGMQNDIWYSSDGATWNQVPESARFASRNGHQVLVFDNKIWVIGGNAAGVARNDVWSSPDGLTWTEVTASAGFSPREGHQTFVFNNRMWVTGGNHNDVWYSSNGMTWTEATGSAAFSHRWGSASLVFNDRMWIIGGDTTAFKDDIWSSADGVTWTQPPGPNIFSPRYGPASVVLNNRIWVIGGDTWHEGLKSDVWSSPDGIIWTRATDSAGFGPRDAFSATVYNNRIWVIGGYADGSARNDVWYSADGSNWILASQSAGFPPRWGHVSVVFDNRIWVIGGRDSDDVWSSPDGITWTRATNSAGFGPRSAFAATVFNNRMWVIGGAGNGWKNDVWSSSDGQHWTRETGSAGFSPRVYHQAVSAGNRMWLIGGIDDTGYRNDVWTSTDGATWTVDTPDAGFPPREGFPAVAFNDKLWVIGGYGWVTDIGYRYFNDVWYREVPVEPVGLTYSITYAELKGTERNTTDWFNGDFYYLDKYLSDTAEWKLHFFHGDNNISRSDFGTDGGGLADSTFHWHFGHGNDWDNFGLELPNNEYIGPLDVKKKWGKENKWVFLYSCLALNNPKWGDALDTSHGIFGFKSTVKPNGGLVPGFLRHAIDDKMPLVNAYQNATIDSFDGTVNAAVIFHNENQLFGDHLPGYGTVEPDGDPNEKPVRINWTC